MSTRPRVTVLMRCRNDAAWLPGVLGALRTQTMPLGTDVELLAFDNASTDASRRLLADAGATVHDVPAGTYNPGRVLNRGVRLARGALIVFLNSDCEPTRADFLERLVAPLQADEADAVYGRQLPRPGADALVRLDHARAYGAAPPRWGPFFSLAAAAMPRALLVRRPLPEHVQYSEDLAWAVAAQRDGLRIRYVPEACVYHSHAYDLRQTWRRRFEEGRADAVIFAGGGRPTGVVRTAVGWGRDVLRDAAWCLPRGEIAALCRAPLVRGVQRLAYLAGRRVGPRRDLSA